MCIWIQDRRSIGPAWPHVLRGSRFRPGFQAWRSPSQGCKTGFTVRFRVIDLLIASCVGGLEFLEGAVGVVSIYPEELNDPDSRTVCILLLPSSCLLEHDTLPSEGCLQRHIMTEVVKV